LRKIRAQGINTFTSHLIPRIYLFPELSTCGYDTKTFDHLSLFVEDAHSGPSFQTFSKVAKDQSCYICYGIPRRLPNNGSKISRIIALIPLGVAISHVVINDQGEVAKVYDKVHLCQFGDCSEKNYFDFNHNKVNKFRNRPH
jgi:predicted amidohydrolase